MFEFCIIFFQSYSGLGLSPKLPKVNLIVTGRLQAIPGPTSSVKPVTVSF